MVTSCKFTVGAILASLLVSAFGIAAQTRETNTIRAEHLLPLAPQSRTFKMIDGERVDELVTLSLRRAVAQEHGEWVLDFADFDKVYLSTDDRGSLTIVRIDLLEDSYAVVYDPPVRLLPSEIRPHVRIEERSVARVYDLNTGRLKHTGQVTHRVRYASRSRFTTPVGQFDGYLIPVEQEIDLGNASVIIDLAGGYVPDLGMVYRRMDYTREGFFGLFGETKRRAAVLAEEPS